MRRLLRSFFKSRKARLTAFDMLSEVLTLGLPDLSIAHRLTSREPFSGYSLEPPAQKLLRLKRTL